MTTQRTFDIVVLGGGPGGYPAAIRAAQSGKTVGLIEAKDVGGTCLNRGCIPSKTLIANAEVLKRVQEAEEFGVVTGSISFDFGKMVARKDRIVGSVRKNLEGLIATNRIELLRGFGKLTSSTTIKVTGVDNVIIQAGKIIIATGSEPRSIPAFPFDHERILDSTSMLEIQALPKSLVIIGGGIIGCEFASLYAALGVEVSIVEMMSSILPMESQSVSSYLTKVFKKKGIKIYTDTFVESIQKDEKSVTVKLAGGEDISAEISLVAVGRSLNTANIGLEAAGVLTTKEGLVAVNEKMETNVPGIYAVGDIASKWWLAHVASHQGLVAAKNACGIPAHMNYNAVPSVIFTDPEIGSVGLSLEAAIAAGHDATVSAFPFQALGKSQAAFQTEGFAQVVTDKRTGQILGAQVVGHEASSLVAEMVVAISAELTIESITEAIHAHPTVAEVWLEAALMASEFPLHLPPKRKETKP
ncbi:MAG: dihydrolipoyl dehydrogenase [Parachlamydiaceae bacterium]|nr:dihydrolipoyl dehydrogenase [Parachlamydiaceae bacterium]